MSMDFAVPEDHRVKIKESKKRDMYLDLAREHRKLLKMKMILTVIGALEMVSKELERSLEKLEIGKRTETIQNTALLRSARIPRRVLETWEEFLSLHWKTII